MLLLNLFVGVVVILSLFLNINESVSTCSFSASGHTLDLTTLSDSEIQSTYKQWTFLMYFCQNALSCQGTSVMALQDNSGTCTSYLAKWPSAGKTATYSSSNGGTWTFDFSNGATSNGCDSGRKLSVDFICTSSSATYDSSLTSITESATCSYEWDIYTKYACVSSSGGGSSSSADGDGTISPGSVLIILVICIIVLYCIIGYFWSVKKSEDKNWKDVKTHTPHLSFWCMIPKWTWAGCCVSKEWTMKKYHHYRGGGGGGGGGDSELITESGDNDGI